MLSRGMDEMKVKAARLVSAAKRPRPSAGKNHASARTMRTTGDKEATEFEKRPRRDSKFLPHNRSQRRKKVLFL